MVDWPNIPTHHIEMSSENYFIKFIFGWQTLLKRHMCEKFRWVCFIKWHTEFYLKIGYFNRLIYWHRLQSSRSKNQFQSDFICKIGWKKNCPHVHLTRSFFQVLSDAFFKHKNRTFFFTNPPYVYIKH